MSETTDSAPHEAVQQTAGLLHEDKLAAHQGLQTDGSSRIEIQAGPPVTADVLSSEPASQAEQKPMSKNALKKAVKAERFAAIKLERRAREKEAKREKKRQRAEKKAAGELDEDDDEDKRRQEKKRKLEFGGQVLVDLGFDEMMNDKVSSPMYGSFLPLSPIIILICGSWI